MNDSYNIRTLTLLSIQRALLGNVIHKMREGWLLIDNKNIVLKFVIDGTLSEEEEEILSIVETELLADLPNSYTVELKVAQSLEPLEKQELFFLRNENN